jgi:hypothetical protein
MGTFAQSADRGDLADLAYTYSALFALDGSNPITEELAIS